MSSSRLKTGTPLSSLLPEALRRLQGEARLSREEMGSVWSRVAGVEAAQHSWPKGLTQKRLVIEVENSGWMYALGMKKATLLEGMIELLGAGKVRYLSFRMGEKKDA